MENLNPLSIAIITYVRAYNYGSALQAYALNKYLRNNGFIVDTIDYTTPSQQQIYRIFEPINGIMSVARNLQSMWHFKSLRKHLQKFDRFISDNIPLTSTINERFPIESVKSQYDFFLCGSDQIWNAECFDFDSNYMLSFINDKGKCIAYAPSLGAGVSSSKTIEALKKYICDFRALSSRERETAEMISAITGRDVETTADPVFLLNEEQWTEIAPAKQIDGEYILGYFIGDRPGMRDFAYRMSKTTGMKVVVINKSIRDIKYGFATRYDAGPSDFLSLIKNSNGIVTNSFHAVAFSLIFQKDFWVFHGKGNSDTRITGILDLVGLQNRIVDGDDFGMNNYLDPIQYSALDMSILQEYISCSKRYLIDNLN